MCYKFLGTEEPSEQVAWVKPPLEKGAEFLVVLNSASMDQRLMKENVRPLQIKKGTRRVKKNRCAMLHVLQCCT